MDTIIDKTEVARAVHDAIVRIACVLPADVQSALEQAQSIETETRGCAVLNQLLQNANIAQADNVPICQDTGTVWVSLEVGSGVLVPADVLSQVDEAVAEAYGQARLRMSVVRDALFDRANTTNNTPAFCDIHPVDEPGVARLHVMLKGGGSDNASRVVMLPPSAGKQGIINEVVRCVREKGTNACPPLVIGVGVGATFDKVAGLAKRALMRPIDEPTQDAHTRAFEEELLAAVNATGVGAGGLGGKTTALAVRVQTAPCHIAALPLAINMGCSAMRRATIDLVETSAKQEGAALVAEASAAHTDAESSMQVSTIAAKTATVSEGTALAANSPAPASTQPSSTAPHRLTLPLSREALAELRAGDACLLSGPLFTLRDAGHARLTEEMAQLGGALPYGLSGQTIFYAGPTPAAANRPFGAVGPTTASRMDFAAGALHQAGVVATVGKGRRAPEIHDACRKTGSVYFVACGGAAAYLAKCVASSEVVAYDDLGTEALRRIEVKDFPVFVGIDTHGQDIYDLAGK